MIPLTLALSLQGRRLAEERRGDYSSSPLRVEDSPGGGVGEGVI